MKIMCDSCKNNNFEVCKLFYCTNFSEWQPIQKTYFDSEDEAREFSYSVKKECEGLPVTCGGDCPECRIKIFRKLGFIKQTDLQRLKEEYYNKTDTAHYQKNNSSYILLKKYKDELEREVKRLNSLTQK